MLLIYQIGDVPLFFDLRAKADDSVSVKTSRSWKVPYAEFNGVSGQTFIGDPYKPVVEAQELDIDGIFICDENVSGEKLLRRVHALGGVPQIPIIALRYEECIHVDSTQCCSKCNPTLDWIVNYGIITQIQGGSDYHNSQEPFSTSISDVSIKMELGTKWKALSKYEWEYRQTQYLNPFSDVGSSSVPFIPFSFDGLNRQSFFYRSNNLLSKYDPTYWGYKYSSSSGGVGSAFDNVGTFEFISDPSVWNAPPNSVYAFTNILNTTSTISLKVRRSLGFYNNQERIEESTLNISQLNTDLSNGGYSGIYASDIIVTGFASPFPGFILRDNAILTVKPRWSYQGQFPGETGIGYNQIIITSQGNPLKVAYLHDFGMY